MNTRADDSGADNDGARRIFGVPVSLPGMSEARAHLRGFEPENPDLFVPRAFGAGWSLNVGALAVKLGLLRPDDSLPDLAEHIPPAVAATLRVAPIAGGAAVAAAGVRAALTHKRLPSNWGLTFTPTRWSSAPAAMAAPVLISAGAGAWAEFSARRGHDGAEVDATAAAQALGLQAMSLLLITAATRRADDPRSSRLWPAAGIVAAPVVTTGVLVATVRSALRRLDRSLRAERPTANR
ncbi:DUF5808 domain-containing protein [Corynebacterium sp.]|uniref:DUF5808 domain-containing protein n=1 Tax=Corynebacterium sp. TaxID=1720 RepID=UPI003735D34A